MSIEGVRFCDVCGGVIGMDDIAPVRVDEDGHMVQLHLHNRHANDCLEQKLTALAQQYSSRALAAVSDESPQEPVQREA
jgi:hypothetical protein